MQTNFAVKGISARDSTPENAHLLPNDRFNLVEPALRSLIPKTFTLSAREPGNSPFNGFRNRGCAASAPEKAHLWAVIGGFSHGFSRKASPDVRVFSRNTSPMPVERAFRPRNRLFSNIPQALTFEKSRRSSTPPSHAGFSGNGSRNASPSDKGSVPICPESPHNLSRHRSLMFLKPFTKPSRQSSLHLPQSFTQPAGEPYLARFCRGVNVFNEGSRVFTSTTL